MTSQTELLLKELTFEIIGSFFTVYNDLGYGFLESVYVNALTIELQRRGLRSEREVPVEVLYEGQPVGLYRMDLVVNRKVLVEVKSGLSLSHADCKQLFNYLRASRMTVGLLFHFGPRPTHRRFVWTGQLFTSE
jgi:GxxExxY protein